jgi:hypothetical protein
MKLFTKEIDKKLFQQYPYGSDLASQQVVAKIFNPYGRGTWYLLNSDPADPDYLWAIVDLFEVEIGSVSRTELESIKVKPFGLGLERDLYFSPVNAKELYEGLQSGKRYANGGISDVEVIEKNNEAYLGMPQIGKGSTMVKLEHGGNLDMLKNQAVQFKHHAEELHNVLKSNPNVDAWVVAKAERASTDLSDITHYLEGSEKMANGGQLSMFEQGGRVKYNEEGVAFGYEEDDSLYEIHYKEENKDKPYMIWDKMDGVYVASFPYRQRAVEYIENKSLGYGDGGKVNKIDFETFIKNTTLSYPQVGYDKDGEVLVDIKLRSKKDSPFFYKYDAKSARLDKYVKDRNLLMPVQIKSKIFETAKYSFANGGNILSEDTVARVDDPAFADVGMYANGGVVKEVNGSTEVTVGNWVFYFDGEGENSVLKEIYHKPTDLNAEFDTTNIHRLGTLKGLPENRLILIFTHPTLGDFQLRGGFNIKKEIYTYTDGSVFAKGGKSKSYMSGDEFREKLEDMSDEELLDYYVKENGFDPDDEDHKERIEEERDEVIDELVEDYVRMMKSTGRFYAEGGKISNGSLVRVKKYGWIMRVDKIDGNMYYLENDRRGTMNGNAGSYLASDIELVMAEGGEIDYYKEFDYGKDGYLSATIDSKYYEVRYRDDESKLYDLYEDGKLKKSSTNLRSLFKFSTFSIKKKPMVVRGYSDGEPYEYAKGGEISLGLGQPVTYRGELYEVTQKDGVTHLTLNKEGAWGSDYPMIPLSMVNQNELRNIHGQKVYIPYTFDKYAKGGKTTFKDKVASIKAKLLKNKKVPKAVQKDYGKTFSPAEAEDSAKRIAGAMRKKEMAKK